MGEHRNTSDEGQGADTAQERDEVADDREVELAERERRVDAREAAQADRKDKEHEILAAAEVRDDDADARDDDADGRDAAADLHSFLHDRAYGANIQARRFAALNRSSSKADREASSEDRDQLTEDDPDDQPVE